jgi:hypothetical protein
MLEHTDQTIQVVADGSSLVASPPRPVNLNRES